MNAIDLDRIAEVIGSLMISQFHDQEQYRQAIHAIVEAFKEHGASS